jgi:hypothetical protein
VTTEHRKAPRRDVVEVSREGAWGKVKYRHLLSCGHTEVRARVASTPKLACAWCLRATEKEQEMRALVAAPVQPYMDIDQKLAKEEIDISKIRATISSRFQIPLEAIDIVANDVNGQLVIKHALIFLSSSDVDRLSKT